MSIESNNPFYELLRRYMNGVFRTAYSRIEYVGLDRIPRDGALIMAPNHTNALMDALTVLTVNRAKTVFVSRADIFRKPLIAKILNFFKIMPIMRMRDGMSNLKKNDEIMHRAVNVLCSGVPFCIFSEGTHRMKHSLLPLTKGIFRIALQCVEAVQGKHKVYILPLGIEYGSYTRYRSTLLVTVGEAINVTEFVDSHNNLDTPEMINALRSLLAERMARLFHCVPDTPHYEGIVDFSYLRNREWLRREGKHDTLYNRMMANRMTVDDVVQREQHAPEETEKLLSAMDEFAALRRRIGIADSTLYHWPTRKQLWGRAALCLLISPYALYCMAVDAPLALIQWLFTRNLEDKAFANSFRFVLVMLVMPLILLALTIVYFISLPWWAALPVVLLTLPANIVANDYVCALRHIASGWKLLRAKPLVALWQKVQTAISAPSTIKY